MSSYYRQLAKDKGEKAAKEYMTSLRKKVKKYAFRDNPELAKLAAEKRWNREQSPNEDRPRRQKILPLDKNEG